MSKKRCRSIALPLQIQAVNCIMANLAEGVPQHLPPIAKRFVIEFHSTMLKHHHSTSFVTVLTLQGASQ